jgi:hypothetical protein
MRTWLLSVLMICAASSAVSTQLPPVGYIGLYTDEFHDKWCANGVGMYQVNMWVWCLPSERGMMCAEFAISYPANVISSTVIWNPEIPIIIDPPPPSEGVTVCFPYCKWDWIWPFYQILWVVDPTPVYVEIIKYPNPMVENIQFANCEPEYPVEPVKKYTNLYINYDPTSSECSGTAVESRSWGAIKRLVVR